MKLCRLLDHHRIPITTVPDIGTLHVNGLTIEKSAIAHVCSAQRQRGAAGSQTPEVRTLPDLVPYVLCQLFTCLDDWLPKASPEERERVAEQIAKALDQLGPDVREEVRRVAGLDDLTANTLAHAGSLSALAAGLAVATAVVEFPVYAMLSAMIASVVGLVGLTLPFSAYITATSLLAFAANPLVALVVIVCGGARLATLANRRMRAELVPLLVAFAALKPVYSEGRGRSRALVAHLADRYEEFLDGDRDRQAQLQRAFPAFRHPGESERASWSSRRP